MTKDKIKVQPDDSSSLATNSSNFLETALGIWKEVASEHWIPIAGQSMLPLIREGDQVLVTHGCMGLRRGDVVVFRKNGRLIAHRILSIDKQGPEQRFIIKGDNARLVDPVVDDDEILGRVVVIKRGDRSISLNTTLWRGLGWLIAIMTLAWLKLYHVGRNFKHKILGPEPNPITGFLRRSVEMFLRFVLKIVQAIAWRGKS